MSHQPPSSLFYQLSNRILHPRANNHTMSSPSVTSSTALPTDFFDCCNCSHTNALKTAVVVLAVMLASSMLTAVAFTVYRSKRWTKKGAASRQAELDELKARNRMLEERVEKMNWPKFFQDGRASHSHT